MEYDQERGDLHNTMADAYLGGMSPLPSTPDATSLLVQTNPAEIIAELEHNLRGEVWDNVNQKWESKQASFLNEEGINKIMTIIRGTVNTNCILSNLNDKEIANIIVDIGKEITLLLAQEYKTYKVEKSNLTTIVNLCLRMSYFSLKRASGEGERRFLKTSVRSSEHVLVRPDQNQQQPQGSSFLRFFKR